MMRGFWKQRRIPLSWLLLTRQPLRLFVALAGICFAGTDIQPEGSGAWGGNTITDKDGIRILTDWGLCFCRENSPPMSVDCVGVME